MTTGTDTELLTAGELLRLYSRGVLDATMPGGKYELAGGYCSRPPGYWS